MAKVYLDANAVIDLIVRNPSLGGSLVGHSLYSSPLTTHVLFYSYRFEVPSLKINNSIKKYHLVNLSKAILSKALLGPTHDLEDNIQLHSAVDANCAYFLTNDKKLLKMKSFKGVQITDSLT